MQELSAIFPEKVKVYNEIVDLMVDMIAKQPTKPHVVKALGQRLSRLGIQLFIMAPDKVVVAYLKWRTLASVGENAEEIVKAYAEMILEMRKDIEPTTTCDVETALDLWG